MSENLSEAEGSCGNMIDPAPIPTAKVVETKKPKEAFIPNNMIFGALASASFFANVYAHQFWWHKMIQAWSLSKMNFLPQDLAFAVFLGGITLIPATAVYCGLKLLGKFTDIGACIFGGLYHTGTAVLSGIGVVFKNIGPITKTCVQVFAGVLCPAYANHLDAKNDGETYQRAFNHGKSFIGPVGLLVSIVAYFVCIVVTISTWNDGGSAPTLHRIAAGYLGYGVLNALYAVGRCAKERREAAQKVS